MGEKTQPRSWADLDSNLGLSQLLDFGKDTQPLWTSVGVRQPAQLLVCNTLHSIPLWLLERVDLKMYLLVTFTFSISLEP